MKKCIESMLELNVLIDEIQRMTQPYDSNNSAHEAILEQVGALFMI